MPWYRLCRAQCYFLSLGVQLAIAITWLLSSSVLAEPAPLAEPTPPKGYTVRDIIALALTQNPEIEILALQPQESTEDVRLAEGELDTTLSADLFLGRQVVPSSSAISGTQYTDAERGFSVGIDKRLSTGTELGLGFDSQRASNSALFSSLDPEYGSHAGLQLKQPLLRGAWDGSPAMRIAITRHLEGAAYHDYEANLADQIRAMVRLYWLQRLAVAEVQVKERSRESALSLLKEAEASVKVGLQAPLAIAQARSQVALRTEELLAAQNALQLAGNQVRKIIGEDEWTVLQPPLELADNPRTLTAHPDVEESLKVALASRPEIRAAEQRLTTAELKTKLARNTLLPDIAIVGSAGRTGLAGSPRANPFDPEPSDRFNGDYSDSLDSLRSDDFYDYRIGLEFRHPLENNSARAEYNRALIQSAQARARLKSLRQTVSVQVKDAVGSLLTAQKRIESAREAREFAQQSMRTGEARFRVGLNTIREVLELQEDLSEAESTFERASVDVENSQVELARARGELLRQFAINIVHPDATSHRSAAAAGE